MVCAIVAGLLPLDLLGELISIGTLMAFALVCLGIHPPPNPSDLVRPFHPPAPLPVLGVVNYVGMMFTLPPDT